MIKNYCILLFLFSTVLLRAQNLEPLHENWYFDIDAGYKTALLEKKNVLIIFNGSDWCSNCKLITNDVLTSPKFKNFIDKNFIVIHLDYKQDTAIHHTKEELLYLKNAFEKFNSDGHFPYFVVTNERTGVLERISYIGNDEREYIKKLQGFSKN